MNKFISKRMVIIISVLVLLTVIFGVVFKQTQKPKIEDIKFTEFVTMMEADQIKTVEIGINYAEKFVFETTDGKMALKL